MVKKTKPLISVLTPTWNRASYLQKVWEGLSSQTLKDYEWIVANDGSTDNTIEVVRELAGKSDFPVTLINASCRIGKSRMDNEAVAIAQGEFIVWCDSDDYFFPNAFETLIHTWESIPEIQRGEFCGVSALCDTKDGVLGNIFYEPDKHQDLVWNELFHKLKSDLVIFTRSDLVKLNPFLEVDYLIPESSVWNKIGTLKTRFIPVVLERKRYREANCLSYSGTMSYNRGKAYAMASSRKIAASLAGRRARLWRAINYLRYCIHGDISFLQALTIWGASTNERLLFTTLLPFSGILALKDKLQGKVVKTHREFSYAQAKVKIKTEKLNFL